MGGLRCREGSAECTRRALKYFGARHAAASTVDAMGHDCVAVFELALQLCDMCSRVCSKSVCFVLSRVPNYELLTVGIP